MSNNYFILMYINIWTSFLHNLCFNFGIDNANFNINNRTEKNYCIKYSYLIKLKEYVKCKN